LSQIYFLGDQTVPLDLWLLVNDLPSTGITSAVTVSVRHRDTDQYLDFSDNRIKTLSSATSAIQTLTEFSGGLYRTTFDSTVDNDNIRDGTTLTAEYIDNNGGRTIEDIIFSKSPAGVNDIVVGGGTIPDITIRGAFTKEDRDRLKRIEQDVGEDVEVDKKTLDSLVQLMFDLKKQVESKKQSKIDPKEIKKLESLISDVQTKIIFYMTPQLPLDKLESRMEAIK